MRLWRWEVVVLGGLIVGFGIGAVVGTEATKLKFKNKIKTIPAEEFPLKVVKRIKTNEYMIGQSGKKYYFPLRLPLSGNVMHDTVDVQEEIVIEQFYEKYDETKSNPALSPKPENEKK